MTNLGFTTEKKSELFTPSNSPGVSYCKKDKKNRILLISNTFGGWNRKEGVLVFSPRVGQMSLYHLCAYTPTRDVKQAFLPLSRQSRYTLFPFLLPNDLQR